MKFKVAHQDETKAARFRALDTCVPIRVGDLWDFASFGGIVIDSFTRKISLENGTGFDQSEETGTIPWPLAHIHTLGGTTKTWAGAPFFRFGKLIKRGDGEEWSPQIERKRLDEAAEQAAIKALRESAIFIKKLNVPTEEKANKQRTLSEIEHALSFLPVFPVKEKQNDSVSGSASVTTKTPQSTQSTSGSGYASTARGRSSQVGLPAQRSWKKP